MSVKLTEQVPAFRIDDDVLVRLWRGVETKWAGEEPDVNGLTVRETVRVAGRRTPEKHEHDYQSVDELRRAPGGPGVLRDYTLAVSSWGKEGREVRFSAYGDGRDATLEVNAASPARRLSGGMTALCSDRGCCALPPSSSPRPSSAGASRRRGRP